MSAKTHLRAAAEPHSEESFNRMAEALEWADVFLMGLWARRWFSWNPTSHIEFVKELARLVFDAEVPAQPKTHRSHDER